MSGHMLALTVLCGLFQLTAADSNFGGYYRQYPIVPQNGGSYYRSFDNNPGSQSSNYFVGRQSYVQANQPTSFGGEYSGVGNIPQSSYWPPSVINSRPADKNGASGQVQFDPPPIQLPTSNQPQFQGYGVNAGVYAGLQSSQSGYNFNYNGQQNSNANVNPNNRPYGAPNTNVGGTYGGLSNWPFVPVYGQGKHTNRPVVHPVPTPTHTPDHADGRGEGARRERVSVRTIPISDLIEDATSSNV
ncbi:hypothetical protein M3Y99_01398700 [Aphelenchoides fujianensis]|nr:hypothetical protein M3Y99_01398700 [Aphelenchoides fujianensis]